MPPGLRPLRHNDAHGTTVIDAHGTIIRVLWCHVHACTKGDTKTSSTTFDWLSVAANQIRYLRAATFKYDNEMGSKMMKHS